MNHERSHDSDYAQTARLSGGLFLSFFTAQAAFVALLPTLPDVAREFGVSVSTAGQLRTAAAVAGLVVSIALTSVARQLRLRRLLVWGLALITLGAALSAVAAGFAVLAIGQVTIGAGVSTVLSAGLAGAVDWPAPEHRTVVLAWTTVGQPAAWVAGMPLIGFLAELDWRWGWLLVPVAAGAAALVLPRERARVPQLMAAPRGHAWRNVRVRRWAFGELMAYAGWGGTLVYAGALLSENYGLHADGIGLLLGTAAVAYFPGTFVARRRLDGDLRTLLAGLALALAAGEAVFGLLRPSAWASTAVLAALISLAGARAIAGSAFGMDAAPAHKVAIGGIRSAATQLGYLMGAAAGGLAVAAGGYGALGLTLAGFFAAAALPHMTLGAHNVSVSAADATQPAFAPSYSGGCPDSRGARHDEGRRTTPPAERLREWHDCVGSRFTGDRETALPAVAAAPCNA